MRCRQDDRAGLVLTPRRLRSAALVVSLFTVGPRVAGAAGSWVSIGPAGAVVNVLAVSPVDPSIAYAGTSGSGLLTTRDGGNTWRVATAALKYDGGYFLDKIDAVAIDPVTPTTLYAGVTGYLFKSLDGGSSWTRLTWPATAGRVQALLVDPTAPATVYAGTDRGITLSTDAGSSWSVVYQSPSVPVTYTRGVRAITVNSSHVVYAGGGPYLARSFDGGRTWTSLSLSISHALVSDSRDPQVLYAGNYGAGVFKTTDGGTTWNQTSSGLANLLVTALTVDPQSGALYAGTDGSGVFESVDAGSHWSPASTGLAYPYIIALAIAPGAPQTLYAGAEGAGLFRSIDGAASWREINGGFAGTQVQKLAAHPSLPLLYAGVYGVDLLRLNRGEWIASASPVSSRPFRDVAVSPSDPRTVWIAAHDGLFKSTDGGLTWVSKAPEGYVNIQSVAVDPRSSSRVYCSADRLPLDAPFFRSDDGGDSWTAAANIGLPFRLEVTSVQAILVDHDTPSTLYAFGEGNVYKSTNEAASWTAIPGLPDAAYAIAMDPQSPRTLYVATYSGVAKTTDGGSTWGQSPASSAVRQAAALLVDRRNSSVVYAAVKYAGVFRSDDAGQTWAEIDTGLASLSAVSLAQDARSGTLYVGTIGRGTFALSGKDTRVLAPRP